MTVRNAVAADAAAILELWARARSASATLSDGEEDIHRLLERDPGSLLVAEEDDELVGALIAAWDGWRGNMYRLAVAPDRRRQGIARRLVEAGEERLRGLGAPRVSALAWREDEPAYGVWQATGYDENAGVARFARNL